MLENDIKTSTKYSAPVNCKRSHNFVPVLKRDCYVNRWLSYWAFKIISNSQCLDHELLVFV